MDSRTRLRQLGQLDLGAWIEAATGRSLWSIQQRVATAASKRRARVAVPSCNASGKSWLAGRLALAFYDSFTPGTPCAICGGPCGGAKILTTSSTHEHLRDALWSEMRIAYYDLVSKGVFNEKVDGRMGLGDNLRLESGPDHFIIGKSPKKAEGFQGFHAPHKLILGDEATSLDDEMQQGITGLLATADSRLLLIFNPTTDDTYAALETRSKRTEVIKITAYDTPHFTGEDVPEGANLTTPEWLEELQEKGMGPGTYEWTTRVLADFWTMGDDVLITGDKFDHAFTIPHVEGTRALGVDLAPYGSDENVIAYRDGNGLVRLDAFPAMQPDQFFEGPVADAVDRFRPDYLIWDADGVGAGAIGYAEDLAARYNRNPDRGHLVLLPFRGGLSVETRFNNTRSAWWWALRRRFMSDGISLVLPPDNKLREQMTDIRYSITASGDIKIEPKDQLKRRGKTSPDRADAVMYAFSMVEELPVPAKVVSEPLLDMAGVRDRSPEAMRKRDEAYVKNRGKFERPTPWRRMPPGVVWDDLDAW